MVIFDYIYNKYCLIIDYFYPMKSINDRLYQVERKVWRLENLLLCQTNSRFNEKDKPK